MFFKYDGAFLKVRPAACGASCCAAWRQAVTGAQGFGTPKWPVNSRNIYLNQRLADQFFDARSGTLRAK
jgi:hypothetical protein